MLRRTEGIVLRTFPFGEADLIVTFLTADFGLIKVFAKSPRKIKSRFGSQKATREQVSGSRLLPNLLLILRGLLAKKTLTFRDLPSPISCTPFR